MSEHSHKLGPEEAIRYKVKAELRKRLRGVRKTMPLEACEVRSRSIVERLQKHAAIVSAKKVALFWPIVSKHEVDLRPLDEALRARGVRVAYPTIDADTNVMTFRFVSDVKALEERGFGFVEPALTDPEATELDAVVVPAIAVDPSGYRIGYGAGYYDRTLPRFVPPAAAIIVAYDFQLVIEVPFTAYDFACGYIVTDAREMEASAAPEIPRSAPV